MHWMDRFDFIWQYPKHFREPVLSASDCLQFRRRSSADVCAKGMPLELCSVRVTFVLLLPVPKIVEYLDSAGVSPFTRWREKLDNVTRVSHHRGDLQA